MSSGLGAGTGIVFGATAGAGVVGGAGSSRDDVGCSTGAVTGGIASSPGAGATGFFLTSTGSFAVR